MSTFTSKRIKVRDQVVAILEGLPLLGHTVYRARTWPQAQYDTPMFLVYGYDETKERAGIGRVPTVFTVKMTMAVKIQIAFPSTHWEQAEAEIERLSGMVSDAILTAPEFLLAEDGIEFFNGVRTVLAVEAKGDGTVASAGLAIEMQWSEVYEPPAPVVECEDAVIAFQPIPAS